MKTQPFKSSLPKAGFVIASELLLMTVILVIGLIVGWVTIRNAINTELEDFAESIGDQDQSFAFMGIRADNGTANTAGSRFDDEVDDVNAADSNDGNIDNDNNFWGSEFTFEEYPDFPTFSPPRTKM